MALIDHNKIKCSNFVGYLISYMDTNKSLAIQNMAILCPCYVSNACSIQLYSKQCTNLVSPGVTSLLLIACAVKVQRAVVLHQNSGLYRIYNPQAL